MRMSLELVVIAIVIIVVAIVMLTIFGGGISQFGTATDARANCLNQGKWSCETSGTLPASWSQIVVYREFGSDGSVTRTMTCKDLVGEASKCCTRTSESTGGGLNIVYKWNC